MSNVWSWELLRAGSFRLDGGSMFGVVPKPLWSRLVEPDGQNRIPLQTNCLLLHSTGRDGERCVLIETGFGDKWSDKERGFFELERRTILDALAEAHRPGDGLRGVDPASVTHVIVTHLHFDHAAGLTATDPSGEAYCVFPNAKIIVQAQEWADARANRSTMTRTYLRDHLDPIERQVDLVEGEREILPGLHVWPMPGHTWGQQAVRFSDGEGTVCFPGDVMPTANHIGLAFSMGYDMLPYENMLRKKALLERAVDKDWRLVLDHEPGNPIVRVERDAARPDRFVLQPTQHGSQAKA